MAVLRKEIVGFGRLMARDGGLLWQPDSGKQQV